MRSAPPEDPSVLENHTQDDPAQEAVPTATPTRALDQPSAIARPSAGAAPPQPTRTTHPLLSTSRQTSRPSPAPTAKVVAKAATFDLLGDLGDSAPPLNPTATQNAPAPAVPGNRPGAAAPTSASTQLPSLAPVVATGDNAPSAAPGAGLFDLDFKAPTPTVANQKPKTSTNDILSLFSTPSGPPAYTHSAVSPPPSQSVYSQQSQIQPQQQQPAVFGQTGSYNAPPTLAPQGQAAYATWTGASGVTAPSGAAPGPSGLASGLANLSLGGAEVWGTTAPVSQVRDILRNGVVALTDIWFIYHPMIARLQPNEPTKTRAPSVSSPYSSQPSASAAAPYAPATSHHYFSSQDVWGTGGAANTSANGSTAGGMTSPGGLYSGATSAGGTGQVKDPFANIWN